MNLRDYTIPAWKVRAERALSWHPSNYQGTRRGYNPNEPDEDAIPRPAHPYDTPEAPAAPIIGYWLAGGRNSLRKLIRYDYTSMAAALEDCNDHAKKWPDYTFAVGTWTAKNNETSWATAIYRYDPETRTARPA